MLRFARVGRDNPMFALLWQSSASGFLFAALVATRRRRAGGAHSLPPSPRTLVAPLPQKSHTASRVAIFGGPHCLGLSAMTRAAFTLSPQPNVFGKLGALRQKRGFATRSKLFRANLAKEMLRFARVGRDNPMFALLWQSSASGFLFAALVATRRRRAGGAHSLPPSPRTLVAPLPQKSHTASRVAIFGGPHCLGLSAMTRAAFTLSP